MKLPGICFGMMLFAAVPLRAADLPPLNVAVDTFSPAFSMQSANNQFYGFDIDMMLSICQMIQRECRFTAMPFSQLIQSVEQHKSDVAVGSIAINMERLQHVDFSLSYMPSQGRFAARVQKNAKPFTLQALSGHTIGVEKGTLFGDAILSLHINPLPVIKEYRTAEGLIAALQNGDIDYAVGDNPGIMFWVSQTSGEFEALGQPFDYGYGLGIAVNKNNKSLLNDINKAVAVYLNSPQFKINYNTYLNFF